MSRLSANGETLGSDLSTKISEPAGLPLNKSPTAQRSLPSVEKVLQSLGPVSLPRAQILHIIREQIGALRREKQDLPFDVILTRVRSGCERLHRSRLQPVINATGILLHTNLGRAPLGVRVIEHLVAIASNYSNLEYDLAAGGRGSRAAYLESSLAILCGAHAATVVNNCAAALMLVLRHFTHKKPEVIISRGELIQIGGGFRIPSILEASGARLREIGTTNQTSITDYAKAIGPQTALILKVHRSNFVMDGFVESPSTRDLAILARHKKVPLVEDLGSGAATETEQFIGLDHEPTAAELLKQGVDLVTFSGDKLLGGPQAGIIAGKEKSIAALKREPIFRALRCDKLTLAALEATVEAYLEQHASESVPLLTMLDTREDQLRARAERLADTLGDLPLSVFVTKAKAQVGGGSLPCSALSSFILEVSCPGKQPEAFAESLRAGSPPVVACISGGRIRFHLRTVFPTQDDALTQAIRYATICS